MDYKKLYFKMFNAATDAVRILEEAQQQCEDMYIEMGEKDDENLARFILAENENTLE